MNSRFGLRPGPSVIDAPEESRRAVKAAPAPRSLLKSLRLMPISLCLKMNVDCSQGSTLHQGCPISRARRRGQLRHGLESHYHSSLSRAICENRFGLMNTAASMENKKL